jgi:hypothetical protein
MASAPSFFIGDVARWGAEVIEVAARGLGARGNSQVVEDFSLPRDLTAAETAAMSQAAAASIYCATASFHAALLLAATPCAAPCAGAALLSHPVHPLLALCRSRGGAPHDHMTVVGAVRSWVVARATVDAARPVSELRTGGFYDADGELMTVLLDAAVRNDASRRDVAPVATLSVLGGVALRKIVIPPRSPAPKAPPECWRAALQTLVDVDTAVPIPDFLRLIPDASAPDVSLIESVVAAYNPYHWDRCVAGLSPLLTSCPALRVCDASMSTEDLIWLAHVAPRLEVVKVDGRPNRGAWLAALSRWTKLRHLSHFFDWDWESDHCDDGGEMEAALATPGFVPACRNSLRSLERTMESKRPGGFAGWIAHHFPYLTATHVLLRRPYLRAVAGTEMASNCSKITLDRASGPTPLGALAELLRVFPRLRELDAGRVALYESSYSCVSDETAASLDRRPLADHPTLRRARQQRRQVKKLQCYHARALQSPSLQTLVLGPVSAGVLRGIARLCPHLRRLDVVYGGSRTVRGARAWFTSLFSNEGDVAPVLRARADGPIELRGAGTAVVSARPLALRLPRLRTLCVARVPTEEQERCVVLPLALELAARESTDLRWGVGDGRVRR